MLNFLFVVNVHTQFEFLYSRILPLERGYLMTSKIDVKTCVHVQSRGKLQKLLVVSNSTFVLFVMQH